jgi:hypothetical protein
MKSGLWWPEKSGRCTSVGVMVRMCACVSGTHFAFINRNSSALISARAHTEISTQHGLRLKIWGRCQYEQVCNDICRRSRPLVSCVRSDQPPRYQDTQPFARLAGGSLQSKTTCSSKQLQVRRLELGPCLHTPVKLPAPRIDSRGPKFRPCGSRANCQ